MVDEEVSSEVRNFIAAHITSVAQLDMLLMLQANPTQRWSPETLARELRIDKRAALEQLATLNGHGLIARDVDHQYRYAPAGEGMEEVIAAVSHAYLTRRVKIIESIFSGSKNRKN